MSDKTPKRAPKSIPGGFSPVSLPESPAAGSPQKNLTGLPRVVRDLVADLYNSIQKWNDLHVNGAGIVKEIATIKSDNPKDFSEGLEKLVNDLYGAVQDLRRYKDALVGFRSQMSALVKLQKQPEALFISHDVSSLARLVEDISKAYEAEFDVKEFVLENIAHVKSKDEAMFIAALWTYQCKVSELVNFKLETLLVETGHRKIK